MQYLIMILIISGLAVSDVITGWIKAHLQNDYSSKAMRTGLYHKTAEFALMCTACGLEYGMELLGNYYQSPELAHVAGSVTAFSVFIYITVMEIISIFENFAEINPQAEWAVRFIRKLRNFDDTKK